MQEEKKVQFSAVDSGVSSFIKKLQGDTRVMFADYMKEAQKQTTSAKEQLKIVEQQIKALKEQNKLEAEQSRIVLERRRSAGTITGDQYTTAFSQIREDAAINKYQSSILKELVDQLKGERQDDDLRPPQQQSVTGQVFMGVVAAEMVKGIINMGRQMISSKNEFDMLSSFAPFGVPVGAPYARHLTSREEYFKAEYGVRGLTGKEGQTGRMSDIGMDLIESTRFEEALVRATGKAATTEDIRRTAVMMKAYSVDQGTALQFTGLQRMGGTSLPATKFLEDAVSRGMDRSLTSDYLKNVSQLTSTIAQTAAIGETRLAAQMILEFDKIGGPFKIRDPRSAGMISGIQQDIANPQSPFAQALSYGALRELYPDKSFVDLMIERQKGGPELLKKQMDILGKSGISEDMMTMMMPSITPTLRGNLAAAQTLSRGRGELGALSGQPIGPDTDYESIDRRAQALTSRIEQGTAEVTDAFIEGMWSGLGTLKDRLIDLMTDAADKSAKSWGEKIGEGIMQGLMSVDSWLESKSLIPPPDSDYWKKATPPGVQRKTGN